MKNITLQNLIRSYETRYHFSISFTASLISNRQEEVFSWQNNIRRPAASLMKLFVLGALAEEIALGNYDAQQRFTVDTYAGGSGVLKYISVPITLTLEELAYFMIAYSDNSATNRILELLTLDRVNKFINKIGSRNTKMVVPMMPTKAQNTKGHNYTTADDILLFYKGLMSGFPTSIHQGCVPLCQKIFAASRLSLSNPTIFLLPDVQGRCLKELVRHNPLLLGKYIYTLLSVFWGKRLTKNVGYNQVVAQKSATDKTVFHDSCVIRLGHDFLCAVAMIQCAEGNFYKPFSKRYIAARLLLRRVSKIALDESHR